MDKVRGERESKSFPSILEGMIANFPNSRISETLGRNLSDELGNGNPSEAHFQHYLQLLDQLAVPRSEFDEYFGREGIRLALTFADRVATGKNLALALGYMLVNEGMTAITYSAAHSAFRRYYPNLRTPFFELHVSIDVRHVHELYGALDVLTERDFENLRFGVEIGERGMAALLDEAFGIFEQ